MINGLSSIRGQNLTLETFEELRDQFLRLVFWFGESPLIITEDILLFKEKLILNEDQRFIVLISQGLKLLFLAELTQQHLVTGWQVDLSFDIGLITDFLIKVKKDVSGNNLKLTQVEKAIAYLPLTNNTIIQQELTNLFVNRLFNHNSASSMTTTPIYQSHSPYHIQSIEETKLYHQLISQMTQGVDLSIILQRTVEEIRQILQIERFGIYQIASEYVNSDQELISYESRFSDLIPSLIDSDEIENLVQIKFYRSRYHQGGTYSIYQMDQEHNSLEWLELTKNYQIYSQLVIPILINKEIWGFMIAHHCRSPHHWYEIEKNFLKQMADYISIIIEQEQLKIQVQRYEYNLSQQVMERTQVLDEALLVSQAANRAKSEFLAIMSHELRTPLTCIIGLSSTLLHWCFGGKGSKECMMSEAKQRDFLQTIHDNGEHLLELINDILDLSKLEAQKTVLNIGQLSLTQLARQLIQTFRHKAQTSGINLKLELQLSSETDKFYLDGKRVKQILINLLGNAIKFTPEGGEVTLRLMVVRNTAILEVEDTGIGIPSDYLPLLFQKFQQLDSSYRRQYGGTGLGLALTKQLVELHGGRIEVESSVNQGSVFTVWLPNHNPNVSHSSSDSMILDQSYPRRIVLVEKDEETATLICEILNAAKYQVIWLMEGFSAIAQIEMLKPIMTIIGLSLSGMSGMDIIKGLRGNKDIPYTKIMGLITNSDLDKVEASFLREVEGYLIKPIKSEELLNKVQDIIFSD